MLLSLFSTLSQPEFIDPENLSDTSTASLGINRTADDSEGLSDTFMVTREQPLTDDPGVTDSFTTVQNFVSTLMDNAGSVDTVSTLQDFIQSLTDSADVSDQALTSQNYIVSFDEQEDISDTTEISFSSGNFDPLDATDTFVLDTIVSADEPLDLNDTTAFNLSVVLTDGAGSSDSFTAIRTVYIELFDAGGLTDDHTEAITYQRSFTDSESALDVISLDRSVVISDNDDVPNAIRFGFSPGFGTFVFGSGKNFMSDSLIASKEFTFTDGIDGSDNFKTVKAVLGLKITVEETEVRWDLG